MNEIHWACPHCLTLNKWRDTVVYKRNEIIECLHCKKEGIITKIRYAFEVGKPE